MCHGCYEENDNKITSPSKIATWLNKVITLLSIPFKIDPKRIAQEDNNSFHGTGEDVNLFI